VLIAFLGALLLAAATFGQNPLPSGNLYGTVLDEQYKSMPGVSVNLSGPGAPQTAVTNPHGDFHFLNLPPGTYSLAIERAGFATIQRDLAIALGRNEVLTLTMAVAAEKEALTVHAESSTLDSRKIETGATFERSELDTIPTTRDPWAILRQVPGVLVANMNVNGSDTGAQSLFVGKGSHVDQNTYNLDGVTINLSYFDFDSLQNIEVVTGGSDPVLATPGVSLNLVTRRGTNELKGSGRADYFFPSSVDSPNQVPSHGGWDYGLEAGGPIWKDHLWLWGAGARNDVPGQTFFLPDGEPVRQKSELQHWNAKLNAQPAPANSLTLFYLHFDKLVEGRGAGPSRSQESTLNQTTPQAAYKVEDSHVFSEKLFASIYFSHLSGDFTLTPQGGLDKQADLDADYVWRNSYFVYRSHDSQRQAGLTSSTFLDTGNLRHELKIGFDYRYTSFDSASSWPGGGQFGYEPYSQAAITRNANYSYETIYYDAYLGDTIQTGNLTVNVALRFDYQQAKNLPSAVPANPIFPELLPAVQYAGDTAYPMTWRQVQPRVGATYALGGDRKTLVRASYSRFANRLRDSEIYNLNAFPGVAYLYYDWQDANGNHRVDRDEVDTCPECLLYARNVDPSNPGSAASVNRIAKSFKTPRTDELIVGIEQEIFPDLSASLAYTHRSFANLEFSDFPLVGVTRADYRYLGNAIGSATDANGFSLSFSEPYYGLTSDPPPTGFEIQNRPDYRESYNGFELQVAKRLSHGWSLQAGFAYNDWTKDVGPGAIVDPNNLVGGSNASGAVAESVGRGRFGSVWINSKWQFNVSGTVQLPLGINLAGNFFGRQGFLQPYFVRVRTHDTRDSSPDIQIGQVDAYRLPDVYQFDVHIEKFLRIGSRVMVTPLVDCFNVANSHTVLGRDGFVGVWNHGAAEPFKPSEQFNSVAERLSDRTFRAGVRISF
jgi:Carboxypeptidase regulatory-like domain